MDRGGKLMMVRRPEQTLVTVRATSRSSPVMGRSVAGVVDYDDAPRVVVLAWQALRWFGGRLA
jgi:hypothetical protein